METKFCRVEREHREKYKTYVAMRTRPGKALRAEYLLTHYCVDCGESDPSKLLFDHVRGKKFMSVGDMVHNGHSLEDIRAEIAKCDVRCVTESPRSLIRKGTLVQLDTPHH